MSQALPKTNDVQYRFLALDENSVDAASRTVRLSFSSEAQVDRWFGVEILDHTEGAVRLSRLRNKGPVLCDHNPKDVVGVVEEAVIRSDKKGQAVVRFGKSARAEEVFQDVKDGIRSHVSVGYVIHKLDLVEERKDGRNVYRAADWEPLEISFTAVPADAGIGVGRNFEIDEPRTLEMKTGDATVEKIEIVKDESAAHERARIQEIMDLSQNPGVEGFNARELAKEFIAKGNSVDDYRRELLARMLSKSLPTPEKPLLGLTKKEAQTFSFVRAIRAVMDGDWTDAGFEREVHREACRKFKRSTSGFLVPLDVLSLTRDEPSFSTDLKSGGGLLKSEFRGESFIEMLRNNMMIRKLGARVMTGLEGVIELPRQTGGAEAVWVGEREAVRASNLATDKVKLTAKTIRAKVQHTKQLFHQTSIDVEQMIREDLSQAMALKIDQVALFGSGEANVPMGILKHPGVQIAELKSTNGRLNHHFVVKLETMVAKENAAVGKLAYLTNAMVRGYLKTTEKAAGTAQFLWSETSDPEWGLLNGYRAAVSNQIPSNLGDSKDRSAIIFGNWGDVLVGEWGVLEVQVDPYTASDTAEVVIRTFQEVDVGLRHPESFAAFLDVDTGDGPEERPVNEARARGRAQRFNAEDL